MDKNRLDYLDISKGFAIFAITLGHIYKDNFIRTWLCSFHLPLFFIICGILIRHTNTNERSFKTIFISRFKRLIIPYFMFELVAILVWMICNNELHLAVLRWNIIDTILLYTKAGATWFLPTLFISEFVFISFKKIIKNDKSIILLSLIIFIIPFFIHTENHFMIIFFRNFTAIGFITFGYYSYEYLIKNDISNKYLVIILLANIILSIFNNTVDLYSLTYNNVFLYSICSISGSILVIFISKKIKTERINKLFKYYGVNSLIVMATQQLILWYVINKVTGIESFSYGYISGVITLVVIMVIQIPIIYIINNYLPFMLGKFPKKKKVQTITD